jgi:hypothetical protein
VLPLKSIRGKDTEAAKRLATLEAKILARAKLDFKDAADKDTNLFKDTKEPNRPVPQLKGFGQQEAKALLTKLKSNANLSVLASSSLVDIANEQDSAVRDITKNKVLEKAEAAGQQVIAKCKPEELADLCTLSAQDRRDQVVKAMGLLKGKHAGESYNDLSEKKRNLVDSFCQGVDAEMAKAHQAVIAHCAKVS